MSWPSPLFDPELRKPCWSPSEGQENALIRVYQAVAKATMLLAVPVEKLIEE